MLPKIQEHLQEHPSLHLFARINTKLKTSLIPWSCVNKK